MHRREKFVIEKHGSGATMDVMPGDSMAVGAGFEKENPLSVRRGGLSQPVECSESGHFTGHPHGNQMPDSALYVRPL